MIFGLELKSDRHRMKKKTLEVAVSIIMNYEKQA